MFRHCAFISQRLLFIRATHKTQRTLALIKYQGFKHIRTQWMIGSFPFALRYAVLLILCIRKAKLLKARAKYRRFRELEKFEKKMSTHTHELPFGGGATAFDKMAESTCTMSRSARRPLEDTLTSSPSSSSIAEREGGAESKITNKIFWRGGDKEQPHSTDWLKPFDETPYILSWNQ